MAINWIRVFRRIGWGVTLLLATVVWNSFNFDQKKSSFKATVVFWGIFFASTLLVQGFITLIIWLRTKKWDVPPYLVLILVLTLPSCGLYAVTLLLQSSLLDPIKAWWGDQSTKNFVVGFYGIVFVYFAWMMSKRLRKVENAIGFLDDPKPEELAQRPVSYRYDLEIAPDWWAILGKLVSEAGVEQEPQDFLRELEDTVGLQKGGLWGKNFSFVIFEDWLSGMAQIWSDYHKTFVKKFEVRGEIFVPKDDSAWLDLARRSMKSDYLHSSFVITPEYLGFDTLLPDGDVMEEDKLASIPFGSILNFFLDCGRQVGWRVCFAVQKFPDGLQKELDRHQVKYETSDVEDHGCGGECKKTDSDINNMDWAKKMGVKFYDQMMRSHTFTTPFYSLHLSVEIHHPY